MVTASCKGSFASVTSWLRWVARSWMRHGPFAAACAFAVAKATCNVRAAASGNALSSSESSLLALNRLWGLNLPRERLAALGLKLGADVPFFIGGHNAFVEGIGERLTPLPVPRAWFAVVKPPAAIATSAIFGSPLLVRNTEAVILAGFLADTAGGFGRNDLQAPAEAHCAEVGVAREILQRRFGNARMTGSGSAVFARAGTGAEPTAAMPADLPPGWVGRMCRSLEQHPLVGWAPD